MELAKKLGETGHMRQEILEGGREFRKGGPGLKYERPA